MCFHWFMLSISWIFFTVHLHFHSLIAHKGITFFLNDMYMYCVYHVKRRTIIYIQVFMVLYVYLMAFVLLQKAKFGPNIRLHGFHVDVLSL